jgi:hypothetical protein
MSTRKERAIALLAFNGAVAGLTGQKAYEALLSNDTSGETFVRTAVPMVIALCAAFFALRLLAGKETENLRAAEGLAMVTSFVLPVLLFATMIKRAYFEG